LLRLPSLTCRSLQARVLSGFFMDETNMEELPLPCVLNEHDVDRLLEALRREHGEAGRADVAPEIARAAAVTARRLEEAAELVPAA
jgi:hypothetical protein